MNHIIVAHLRNRWLSQTETWIYEQVRYLPPEIENHVVCSYTENIEQFRVPNIHSLGDRRSPLGLLDKAMRRLRLRTKEDSLAAMLRGSLAQIAHSHFGNNAWQNLPIVRRTGARHVVTFYGMDASRLPVVEPVWNQRYHELFASVDRVFCEGPFMGRTIAALGCPPEKLRVHHLGVKVDQIPFAPRQWVPGQPLRVLIAGSFREKKGIPYAIEALAVLARSMPVEITIVGDASSEPRCQEEKQKIVQAITTGGLEKQTRLLGFQPHKILFQEADRHHIFLSPSVSASDGDTEGGAPVSIIEMMASGMPIVSTTHCDIPNVVARGAGLLAPERDVPALVEHLLWLAQHPSDWTAITTAARRHVEKEFNCATQGQRLAEVYQEIISTPAARTSAQRQSSLAASISL